MRTSNRDIFTTIHSEGALLPSDLLQRVSNNDPTLDWLTPESYHLAPGERLNEAINRSWNRMVGLWGNFVSARVLLSEGDTATTLTRERWLLPLFDELGYGRLPTSKAELIGSKSYPISHRWQHVPIHLIGSGLEVDKRTPGAVGAARVSPHSLMQEYLNRNPDIQWGIVSNGLVLRVMRDNVSLTRQAYLNFDLAAMFEGEVYSDFVILWLVCHQSRFEKVDQDGECILENWSELAAESGTRALDDLRNGVEQAIVDLGQGFLSQPDNRALRGRLQQGQLSAQGYYRQLLRLVYRLIFLFTAEDRDLLLLPHTAPDMRARYLDYYSTARLRALAERQRGTRHHDRYETLKVVLRLLGSPEGCPDLALPALGGLLFDPSAAPDLDSAVIDNRAFLDAIRSLAFITEGRTLRPVDYRNLGPDELGSVYESLLELHPQFNLTSGAFELISAAGNERKTTGSHYTRPDLVNELIASALDPVIADRLKAARADNSQEQAMLSLTVCDPACGSGHFLVAAAHRIAGKLAEVRSGGAEPTPGENRAALREVIRHCIYGVDINPMAVELCKVNLWLEALEPGKPLSFLDAHIQCGNSLVGVGPSTDYTTVPDEAFDAKTGDDKKTASYLKRRNRGERGGTMTLLPTVYVEAGEGDVSDLSQLWERINTLPDDTFQEREQLQAEYQQLVESERYAQQKTACDLWTAAFFWPIEALTKDADIFAPTQAILNRWLNGEPIPAQITGQAQKIAREQRFFHWELAFPNIFKRMPFKPQDKRGGFDVILGNPPWERIKLQEEEFFAVRDPEIAEAPNKAARGRMIKKLKETNPLLAKAFQHAKHSAECTSKFVRNSGRFALTAVGDVNTYALFAEHCRDLVNEIGRTGIIVPTGIATDDTTKTFFGDLVDNKAIASLFDFENREPLFAGVHRMYKFCLLTLSGAPVEETQFVFFATRIEHLRDPRRRFTLKPQDIALFNPNTKTMPVFRTRQDAELTRAIYQRVPVLVNETTHENPWGVSFMRMFDMSNDSHLFATEPRPGYVRLYEAKMIWQFDHRYANYEAGSFHYVETQAKEDPDFFIKPRYWVPIKDKEEQLAENWENHWFLCYRRITNATNERTMISCISPRVGLSDVLPIIFTEKLNYIFLMLCDLNSLCLDYIAKQKIGGLHIDFHHLKQLLSVSLEQYSESDINYIKSKAIEMVYTADDLNPFVEDLGYSGEPFAWDEERRAILRAELDAYYARLYGLNRKQLRYILDPADLTQRELEDILDPWEEVTDPLDPDGYAHRQEGSDFPGETFRVLKDKEVREFGEYRTRRLVLEAWERIKDLEVGVAERDKDEA